VKNSYPLPFISDLLDSIGDTEIFTKLDIHWGYNNVLIKAEDRWKATFKCAEGLFAPVVMFYGLTNSPPTFQAFMEWVFADFLNEGWLKIFIDDMLIKSRLMWEHKEREIKVLARLTEHDLFLKPEKCEFSQRQVEYLGFLISKGNIRMDPKKL
jgi:hypothetical protein